MAASHDWLVVGPWWSWPKVNDPLPRDGARATRPVIQKYADSRLVERFLADPQDALRFIEDEDRLRTDRLLGSPIAITNISTGKQRLQRSVSIVTQVRKLYRDTHQRFYLVACSVHCDRPGLPMTRRSDVVRAEFVVRRRRPQPAPELSARQRTLLARRLDETLRAEVEHQQLIGELTNKMTGLPIDDDIIPTLAATANASDALTLAKTRLVQLGGPNTERETLERWATGPNGEPARWRVITDSADEGVETTYPLYPLLPADGDDDHDGTHGSIWFGLVPTGSDETAPDGTPRFTSNDDLEIRCVVHRRNPACPDNDDHAIAVWSRATERYRLAPHTDALGLANRPVTLPAPDLNQLKAQARLFAPGRLSSARVEQAAGSRYSFPENDGAFPDGDPVRETGDEVCFTAIPLITFVAMFLLQIFLPILLFLLNLWWMLQLKFCIPSGVSFDLDLSADVLPGDGNDLDDVVDFEDELSPAELAMVAAAVDAQLALNNQFTPTARARIVANTTVQERWEMMRSVQRAQDAALAGTLRTGGTILPMDRVAWSEVALR